MNKESNGIATKKLKEKPGQAENQVEKRNSGVLLRKMGYTNINQRKVEGVGKDFCPAVG